MRVYPEDPHSWINKEEAAAEQPALTALHAELLLPLQVRQELLGFLSLGPKLSEEPYSPSDVRLLSSVAAQTALALENGRLNPPFLVRANGRVERLSDGGPVVGLIPLAAYSTFETTLRAGDRLVGYTDGISEAMNRADNEWSEELLLEAIVACDGQSARDTIETLLRAADAFVAGPSG